MAALIHIVPCDAEQVRRGQVRALCGALVDDTPFRRPTCSRCIEKDAAEERALESLQEEAAQ